MTLSIKITKQAQNLCGNYFTAKAHIKALRAVIKAAGGVKYFAENDSVPRAFAW